MPSENVLHGTKLNEEDLSSDTTSSFENGKAMKKLKLEDNIIAKARGEGRKDGASDNLAIDATHTIVNSLVWQKKPIVNWIRVPTYSMCCNDQL